MTLLRYLMSSAIALTITSVAFADNEASVAIDVPKTSDASKDDAAAKNDLKTPDQASKDSTNSKEDNTKQPSEKLTDLPREIPLPDELKPVPVQASSEEIEKIEKIIMNFLSSEKGLQALQKAQLYAQYAEAKHELETRHLLDDNKSQLITDKGTITLGNPKGSVTLVLVADPLCANCRVLENILRKVIKQQPSLRVIVHQWAFVNPEESARVTRDLQAAYRVDPKLYNKLHEAFLALRDVPDQKTMNDLIKGAKYDLDKVHNMAKSDEITQSITRVRDLAKTLKFPGAPILMAVDPEEGRLMIIPPVSDKELNEIVSKILKSDTKDLKQELSNSRQSVAAPAA